MLPLHPAGFRGQCPRRGYYRKVAATNGIISLVEFFNVINKDFQFFPPPSVGSSTHLVAQVRQEFGRVGDLLPYLWKERGTMNAIAQDDSIHTGMKLGKQIRSIRVIERNRKGQPGNFDLNSRQFTGLDRGKAIILESSSQRMFANIFSQGLIGLQRPDTAAQVASSVRVTKEAPSARRAGVSEASSSGGRCPRARRFRGPVAPGGGGLFFLRGLVGQPWLYHTIPAARSQAGGRDFNI